MSAIMSCVRSGLRLTVVAGIGVAMLAACGGSSKNDQAAFEACLAQAKADAKLTNAKFESFENSKVAGSTGDEDLRVNIPYDLAGQKGVYQCIARKQQDGTFKAVY